ncbi:MAG TPA: protein kinase, partial [Planctomycetota bacterium]|nr:protein kinase [Planctomycetota bacterium]
MPSSSPEHWEDALFRDLSRHEHDRESLGFPQDAPDGAKDDAPDIPRYEVLERLGEGATSVVYRARDRELGRIVALKVHRMKTGWSEVARQRFRREAQAAASLSHPNVVTVHDVGEHGRQLYLVMELVDGRPLSKVLEDQARDRGKLLRQLEKAARGVAAA